MLFTFDFSPAAREAVKPACGFEPTDRQFDELLQLTLGPIALQRCDRGLLGVKAYADSWVNVAGQEIPLVIERDTSVDPVQRFVVTLRGE